MKPSYSNSAFKGNINTDGEYATLGHADSTPGYLASLLVLLPSPKRTVISRVQMGLPPHRPHPGESTEEQESADRLGLVLCGSFESKLVCTFGSENKLVEWRVPPTVYVYRINEGFMAAMPDLRVWAFRDTRMDAELAINHAVSRIFAQPGTVLRYVDIPDKDGWFETGFKRANIGGRPAHEALWHPQPGDNEDLDIYTLHAFDSAGSECPPEYLERWASERYSLYVSALKRRSPALLLDRLDSLRKLRRPDRPREANDPVRWHTLKEDPVLGTIVVEEDDDEPLNAGMDWGGGWGLKVI